ncbi:hypothetical protein N665_0014s0126 [Sinapis alba]|nr:hypothetical protein N665_0014s0126 [Sinapis alba]
MWNNLNPLHVIGTPTIVKEMDCLTAKVSEIEEVRSNVNSVINGQNTRLCGFGGWVEKKFLRSKKNELTTASSEQHCTHWGQQGRSTKPKDLFSLCLTTGEGDSLNLGLVMRLSKEKHRLVESFKKMYFIE